MGRYSRTGAFWVLLVLISFLAFQFLRGQDEAVKEFTFTEFMDELEGDRILSVTVIEGQRIEGELRTPYIDEQQEYTEFTTTLLGEISEELISQLQEHDVELAGEVETRGWGTLVIGALPWIIIIAFWFWIFRTMQSGGNRAFQFGRSKAKLISPDTPEVTFADVAGAEEAKAELEEIIDFLKDPQKFSRLGGRLPKGVLLVGPPGTGKTLLAKAVAGEASRPFFQMSGSDFVEMFVGVGASRVRDLFEQGKAHAPCIIFIDEMDAVGRHRGAGLGGGHDEREQTLNALLVEMDGFESNEGVILLAATNRPDVLDPALLRPGRFDRQVVVDSPDVRGREGILRVHAKKLPLADDVDLKILAKGTPGMSGADLANICNEAALLAARYEANKVNMHHFEQAKDKVMLGAERKSLVLTDDERRLTAFHEAGHAVVGLRLPGLDPIHKITIVPRGQALGITSSLPREDRHSYTKEWLEGQLCMLFGGRVAEELVFGPNKVTTGAGNDIERATTVARNMVTRFGMSDVIGLMAIGEADHEIFLGREISQRRHVSEHTAERVDIEIRRILNEAHQQAREIVEEHRNLLNRIAEALLDRETLAAPDIQLLDEGKPLPALEIEDGHGEGGGSGKAEAPDGSEEKTGADAVTNDEASATEETVEGGASDNAEPVAGPAVGRAIENPEADASG